MGQKPGFRRYTKIAGPNKHVSVISCHSETTCWIILRLWYLWASISSLLLDVPLFVCLDLQLSDKSPMNWLQRSATNISSSPCSSLRPSRCLQMFLYINCIYIYIYIYDKASLAEVIKQLTYLGSPMVSPHCMIQYQWDSHGHLPYQCSILVTNRNPSENGLW